MDRKLIVTLLQKHIKELEMITEGFMEMTEYPKAIISLARNKTEDILEYIKELESIKNSESEIPKNASFSPIVEPIEKNPVSEVIQKIVELNSADNEFDEFQNDDLEEELDDHENYEEEDIEEDIEDKGTQLETSPAYEDQNEEDEEIDLVSEINSVDVEIEKTVTTTTIETVVEEKISVITSESEINTIADTHSNKKIDDIRQAISIGDRFRFQRELFDGNGELLNKTLVNLNKLKDFDEAYSYLHKKFKWNDEDETVENFYQIVRRRYL